MTVRMLLLVTLAAVVGCATNKPSTPDGGRPGTDSGFPRVDSGGGDCRTGEILCGGFCVDPTKDLRHCGHCDNPCSLEEVCEDGACRRLMTCGTGEEDCGGTCVDITTDDMNCGRCGNACTGGDRCMGATCQPESCPPERPLRCGDACTDPMSDAANCGMCGNRCTPTETCSGGRCSSVCEAGETPCMDMETVVCVNTSTSDVHCGMCNHACTGGRSCVSGSCDCPSGRTDCGGTCVDTDTDPMNCGRCGMACGSGTSCDAGSCGCPGGLTSCGGRCVNTDVDNANCGMCGHACATPAETCAGGTCTSACGTGTTMCGGSCVSVLTDDMNCGMCGHVCGSGTSCAMGVCRPGNDDRGSAVSVTLPADGSEATVTGTTDGATRDGPTVDCSANGPNVWYSFTLSGREVVWVDTAGSSYDTAVFLTNSSGTQVSGMCNDDCGCSGGDFTSRLQSCAYSVLSSGTYYVSVGGYSSSASGDFTLHIQHLPDTGFLYSVAMTGVGTTTETGLLSTSEATGSCDGGFGSRSGEDQRWFASCGTAMQTFSLCQEDGGTYTRQIDTKVYDPVMYVRAGSTGGEVECNDDGPSTMNCRGTGGDSANFGSRISGLTAPRGVSGVFIDSRGLGGGGMRYQMRYDVPAIR